jgi:hypothetical protein
MMDQQAPKHVGVSGFYDVIVHLMQRSALIAFNYSNCTAKEGKENVKRTNLCCRVTVYIILHTWSI